MSSSFKIGGAKASGSGQIDPAKVNIDRLHRSMAKITNYTGIMNYLGGRFLSEQAALEPVMRDIGKRGLLFLDDASSAQSLSGGIAKAISAPQGFADVLLDGEVTEATILRKLDELERIDPMWQCYHKSQY